MPFPSHHGGFRAGSAVRGGQGDRNLWQWHPVWLPSTPQKRWGQGQGSPQTDLTAFREWCHDWEESPSLTLSIGVRGVLSHLWFCANRGQLNFHARYGLFSENVAVGLISLMNGCLSTLLILAL